MNAIVPIPKCEIAIRPATMQDLPFLDALQKKHSRALGYFPTRQFEGYIEMGAVLVAEEVASCKLLVASKEPLGTQLATSNPQLATRRLGYIIARDRYLKRDELGIIYQLCVDHSSQRKLIGAALLREVFNRSAYGCRLYCCWCAQDLEANHFWESMGFVPIAFRAGSSGKKRVHIFWQKRIRADDATTPWWFPAKTESGAIREDRLVFPIPPGVHWKDVMPVLLPGAQKAKLEAPNAKRISNTKSKLPDPAQGPLPPTRRHVQFGPPGTQPLVPQNPSPPATAAAKPRRPRRAATPIDPKLVSAARELRDRVLEQINLPGNAPLPQAKYHVSRQIAQRVDAPPVEAQKLLPEAA